MSYYDPLIEKWNTLQGSIDERLNTINNELVDGPKIDVPISKVTAYLLLNLKLASLIEYVTNPPANHNENALLAAKNLVAFFNLPSPPAFATSDNEIYQICQDALYTIASDPLSSITNNDVSNMMALADNKIYWWKANGYPEPINYSNLKYAQIVEEQEN